MRSRRTRPVGWLMAPPAPVAVALLLPLLVLGAGSSDGGLSSSSSSQLIPAGCGGGGGGDELRPRQVVYLGLVDGSVVAWDMDDGEHLWNFTSLGRPGSTTHDVVSEFGKPNHVPPSNTLVTELGGQGKVFQMGPGGGTPDESQYTTRDLVQFSHDHSGKMLDDVLTQDGQRVLLSASVVTDVYGLDPVGLNGELNMKYCKLDGRDADICDAGGGTVAGKHDAKARTLIVRRTTTTMSEISARDGTTLWNRSVSAYDMSMSHPGFGGDGGESIDIVQRVIPPNASRVSQTLPLRRPPG
jgi:hypothetical protein